MCNTKTNHSNNNCWTVCQLKTIQEQPNKSQNIHQPLSSSWEFCQNLKKLLHNGINKFDHSWSLLWNIGSQWPMCGNGWQPTPRGFWSPAPLQGTDPGYFKVIGPCVASWPISFGGDGLLHHPHFVSTVITSHTSLSPSSHCTLKSTETTW